MLYMIPCKFNVGLIYKPQMLYTLKLSELKTKIEKDRKLFEVARAENTRLTDCIEELNLEIRKLQGEVCIFLYSNSVYMLSLLKSIYFN